MDDKIRITQYLDTVINTCQHIDHDKVAEIFHILCQTADANGKIYICGNGGSALTASHFQSDLNQAFAISRQIMPAVCLTDNTATLTATSNDISYEDIFRHPLQYLLRENDVLIAISGSGNSVNVLKAAELARQKGNTVVSLVGFDGGKLKSLSDHVFHVPVNNMQIAEDFHLLFCHLVSTMIKEGDEV